MQITAIDDKPEKFIKEGVTHFTKRINYYIPCELTLLKSPANTNNLSTEEIKKAESQKLQKAIKKGQYIIVLDEKGTEMNSRTFSSFIDAQIHKGTKSINIIIGGAHGLHSTIYNRADKQLSLSKFTLSHRLARLIICEQIYRALTLLHNHPYHKE